MSARRGSLTLTRLFVRGAPPRDLRKRYLQAIRTRRFEALKPEDEPIEGSGWCVIDRPFDLEFDAGNVYEDRFLLLGFRTDRFRIPASMVRSLLADEEQRLLAKTGKNRLSRNERLEIKDKIVLRLRRKLPPSTRCLDMVWDLDSGVVLFFSHSQRALADFSALFEKTFGLELDEDSPYLAAQRAGLAARVLERLDDVEPLAFSVARAASGNGLRGSGASRRDPANAAGAALDDDERAGASDADEPDDAENEQAGAVKAEEGAADDPLSQRIETTRFLGPEFLLWIWLRNEFLSHGVELADGDVFHAWLDRQIVLESPLDRNERVTIRGVAPADGNEAREALGARKLPVRARIVLHGAERDFMIGLDAPRFAIAGATLPAVLSNEASEAFLERMALAEQLFQSLDRLYGVFLADRLAEIWKSAWQPAIGAWLEDGSVPAALLQALSPRTKAKSKARQRGRSAEA